MKSYLSRFKIQIVVAILTILGVYFFPLFKGSGDAEGVSAFRSVFGQFAVISFALYIGISATLIWIIGLLKLSPGTKYMAHLVAFIIGYSLLYFLYLNLATMSNFGSI